MCGAYVWRMCPALPSEATTVGLLFQLEEEVGTVAREKAGRGGHSAIGSRALV